MGIDLNRWVMAGLPPALTILPPDDCIARTLAEDKKIDEIAHAAWVNTCSRLNHLLDTKVPASYVGMESPSGGFRLPAEAMHQQQENATMENSDEETQEKQLGAAGMQLMGMDAICKHVKMSHSIVLSWIREAGFPARKICGRGKWMSDTDEIAAWLKRYVAGGIHENASTPPYETKKSGKRKGSRI